MPVKVIAGCIAIGRAPIAVAEAEHGEAVAARGVADDLSLADGAGADELGDDVLEHVVGHGEQQQVAGTRDVGRLGVAYAGQQRLDAVQRGCGVTRGGHDVVTSAAECRRQYGADTTGADNPDSGHQNSSPFVPVPSGYRTTQ